MNKLTKTALLSLFLSVTARAFVPENVPVIPPVPPAPAAAHAAGNSIIVAAPVFAASLVVGITYRAWTDYCFYSALKKEIAQALIQLEYDMAECEKNPAHCHNLEKSTAHLKSINEKLINGPMIRKRLL